MMTLKQLKNKLRYFSAGFLIVFMSVISLVLISTQTVAAQNISDSAWVETGEARTQLLAEGPFVPGETVWFALHQKLSEGWHVYWKNPGDSGLPLVMNWSLPDDYVVGEIYYPSPERIPVAHLVNFGFHHDPTFLVPVTVPENAVPGENIDIQVSATWLICEEVCIPEDAVFDLKVPVADNSFFDPQRSELFNAAREAFPQNYSGLATFKPRGERVDIAIDMKGLGAKNGTLKNPFIFLDKEGSMKPAAEQVFERLDDKLIMSLETHFAFDPDSKEPMRGVLAFEDGAGKTSYFDVTANYGVVPTLTPAATVSPVSKMPAVADNELLSAEAGVLPPADLILPPKEGVRREGSLALPVLLLLAFFGGVILNVMPCVFPILFIKASSLISASHDDRSHMRAHGWLYTAGVVATFALMGAVLLILRGQGERLGWGFHLQSPVIVLLSSYVLLLVGLNLAGVFHVGTSLQGVGEGLSRKQGAWGAFFTGALAVVVAAPCIGPLLSAPMGAAVLLPPISGMLIFIVMGLGLAFPYLLISLVPIFGRLLPKPGGWMELFKQFLAFPVFAGAAYFLWVLSAQAGPSGLAIGLIGALLLSLAVWLFELGRNGGSHALILRGLAGVLVIVAMIPAMRVKPVLSIAQSGEEKAHGALTAVAFDREEITQLNRAGKDVFVDFTAAWCVTCQFNKSTIFSSNKIADAFSQTQTVLMVADWTVRDPKITAALQEFDRNGVPLYVFYPAEGARQILPLPLTKKAVLSAIQ